MHRILCALTTTFAPLVLTSTLVQAAPQIGSLRPAQIQQFSRDLVRPSSRDFFEAGQRSLEREVQLLTQHRLLTEGVLKVSQEVTIQRDRSQFERPKLLLPQAPAVQP